MKKRAKRIAAGPGKGAVKARKLYKRIEAGAGEQRRIQALYERKFFSPDFASGQLVEEAKRFGGSRRQRVELVEYAKRLARKRDWALKMFRKWGLKANHMSKPLEKTPKGVSAKKILLELTEWTTTERVKMVPFPNLIAFSVGAKPYKEIFEVEFPKTGKTPCFIFSAGGEIAAMVSPNLGNIKKYGFHEREHTVSEELPLAKEIQLGKRKGINKRKFTQSYAPTNLRLGAKAIGRRLLDELITNTLEKRIDYFEKKHRTYYLADYSGEELGPKTAASFMRNKGNHKARMLRAAEESAKAVRKALSATVKGPRQEKVKVVTREELASWLRNIRDIERVPKRLPVLVEMRKERLGKRPAGKGG